MIFRSIRWRIQLWHGALLVIVVTGFGVTAHRLASADRLRQVDESLQADAAQLAVAVPPPPDERAPGRPQMDRLPPPPREGNGPPDPHLPADHYFIVWLPDGREQIRSANAPPDAGPPAPAEDSTHATRTRGRAREFYRFTGSGRCFLVGKSIAGELDDLRRLAWYLAAAGGAVLAVGLIGGGWLAARAIQPIAEISATAEKIAAGDLAQRIPRADADNELGRLAGVLNSTFSRLEAAFTQQARFSADAAHELRTPVTVMLTHAQNGLACEGLAEEPREAFAVCQRAAQRMRRLLESLLELARLDSGQERMKPAAIDLADLARNVLELVSPLAETRQIAMHVGLSPAMCRGDAGRLGQVVTNLLTNAIEYNRQGGDIWVETGASAVGAYIVVMDAGPGIAAADLPHVFERFYRADAARSSGHAGLGLAISKAIVEAHGGVIEAANAAGKGAAFTMRLPAATEAEAKEQET